MTTTVFAATRTQTLETSIPSNVGDRPDANTLVKIMAIVKVFS